jgi:hypothetical protein
VPPLLPLLAADYAIKTKAQKLKHHTGKNKNISERNWIS